MIYLKTFIFFYLWFGFVVSAADEFLTGEVQPSSLRLLKGASSAGTGLSSSSVSSRPHRPTSSSVGSRPSSSSGSFSSSSGGSGYSLKKGIGNRYSTGTYSISSYKAQGSCCQYLCCSSGIKPGYSSWWYRGYRPTRDEQVAFQEDLGDAGSDIRLLAQVNGTDTILTEECALVNENGTLAERETVTVNISKTLRTELTSLANRIDTLEEILTSDVETDVSDDLRGWFLDFYALQPCLEELSELSESNEAVVLETRQKVEEAELAVNAWEARLASGGGSLIGSSLGMTIGAVTLLSMILF